MPTTMQIDGFEIPVEYDPDEDLFYGRDPGELRANVREALKDHPKTP